VFRVFEQVCLSRRQSYGRHCCRKKQYSWIPGMGVGQR
jgi:hypothetical protein